MLDEDMHTINITSTTNSMGIKRTMVKRQEKSNFSAHLDSWMLNTVNS
jgi:hypothetical protein